MTTYETGNTIRINVEITNASGAAIDPDNICLKLLQPGRRTVTQTYGIGGNVVRTSTGVFHYDLDLELPGNWSYRWTATGSGKCAASGTFVVKAASF